MKTVLHNIQGLRGIAVLLVVALHLYGAENKYSPDQLLPDLFVLGNTGVDIFFVISGFIMVTTTQASGTGPSLAARFLFLRGSRIYPLYWIVTLGLLAIAQLFPGITTPLSADPVFLLKSFLLYPQDNLPLLMVGWTLIHEIYFYLVFTLLLLLPAILRPTLLLLWAVFVLYSARLAEPATAEANLVGHPLTLEFIAGCFLGLLAPRCRPTYPRLLFTCGCVLLAGSWWYWQLHHPVDPLPLGMDRVLCFLPGAWLMTWGCVAMDQHGQRPLRWLESTGDASYSIYLTHVLFLAAILKGWQFLPWRDTLLDNLLLVPAVAAVTLAGGTWCYRLVEKPLLRSMRRLAKAG